MFMRLFVWPLPALLACSLAWACFVALESLGLTSVWAFLGATLFSALLSNLGTTLWRRCLIVLGFPLSQLLINSTVMSMPPLAWLGLVLLIAAVYPLNAWSDAPLFPTPSKALVQVPEHIQLGPNSKILDAGCGLGDGLRALRSVFPQSEFSGLEMSWPLRFFSALRCPWAKIRQGNIWLADWSEFDMVYMFQRPESMPKAVEKASQELKPGAWLVSLEFEARLLKPNALVYGSDGRPVWMYQAPFTVL